MSDISVALSSTKHLIKIEGSMELTMLLREKDWPICVAEMGMFMYGFGSLEREELGMAQMCKDMAKVVHVDSARRYVFVGENPDIPETGLIEYTDDRLGDCSKSFFEQWDLLKCLFLEFSVQGAKGPMFCIKGFWDSGSWKFLDIYPRSQISIITPKSPN
jgi:hypothetical protein